MIYVVNYANDIYRDTQKYCTKKAYKFGADKVFEYGPNDLDKEFVDKYYNILQNKRGNGYWLWKPYIINDALKKIKNDDYLLYVDSGAYFINNISLIIKEMIKNKDEIISFGLPFIEKEWTKNAIFQYFKCENVTEIVDTNQRLATFIFLKKSDRTVSFMSEFLKAACYDGLITDSIGVERKCFIENRHDQSIFSVLAKIEKIPVYRDPSEYGIKPKLLKNAYSKATCDFSVCSKGNYPQLLVLHRKKKVTFYVKIVALIRKKFSPEFYRAYLKMMNILISKKRREV